MPNWTIESSLFNGSSKVEIIVRVLSIVLLFISNDNHHSGCRGSPTAQASPINRLLDVSRLRAHNSRRKCVTQNRLCLNSLISLPSSSVMTTSADESNDCLGVTQSSIPGYLHRLRNELNERTTIG